MVVMERGGKNPARPGAALRQDAHREPGPRRRSSPPHRSQSPHHRPRRGRLAEDGDRRNGVLGGSFAPARRRRL